jgi:hypothetical protein
LDALDTTKKLAAAPGSLDEVPCDSSDCRDFESYLSGSRGTLLGCPTSEI